MPHLWIPIPINFGDFYRSFWRFLWIILEIFIDHFEDPLYMTNMCHIYGIQSQLFLDCLNLLIGLLISRTFGEEYHKNKCDPM